MLGILKHRLLLVVALLLAPGAGAQALALSFDDGLDPRKVPEASEWNARILEALAQAGVKAAFFPAGRNVDSPEGLALVRAWGEAGHAIGNHTYQHANLNALRMTVDQYTADIARAQALLGPLPGWTPRLRFPYLKEGNTAAKRDGVRAWMAQNGYEAAPVSIETSDWYYSQRYSRRLEARPGADPAPYRDAYLRHLWDRATYYEGLARDLLGRSPAHVMLLHTNRINAAFLPDVIAMFRAKGWKVVDAGPAFADPLYRLQPRWLPAGESILWAIAKDARRPGLRYPAEDDVYEKASLDALEK